MDSNPETYLPSDCSTSIIIPDICYAQTPSAISRLRGTTPEVEESDSSSLGVDLILLKSRSFVMPATLEQAESSDHSSGAACPQPAAILHKSESYDPNVLELDEPLILEESAQRTHGQALVQHSALEADAANSCQDVAPDVLLQPFVHRIWG